MDFEGKNYANLFALACIKEICKVTYKLSCSLETSELATEEQGDTIHGEEKDSYSLVYG